MDSKLGSFVAETKSACPDIWNVTILQKYKKSFTKRQFLFISVRAWPPYSSQHDQFYNNGGFYTWSTKCHQFIKASHWMGHSEHKYFKYIGHRGDSY